MALTFTWGFSMATFKENVQAAFNADKGNAVAAITKDEITPALQKSGLDDTVSDYTSEQASNITTVTKATLLANKSTYGIAKLNDEFLDSALAAGGFSTIKNFGPNGAENGSLVIKDGGAYYIDDHSDYDKFMETLEVKVAQKTATAEGFTTIASALGTTYNTKKGSW